MAAGGIYDHVGGGFHRYAVDAAWRVPHFEKMLYDQAQIVMALLDAFQITRAPLYAQIARETIDYVLRDLRGPDGEFYSAEDADSPRPDQPAEHGEGAFYTWRQSEITTLLGDDAPEFITHFGVEPEGNAPFDPGHEFTGVNILFRSRSGSDDATVTTGSGNPHGR